MKKCSLCNKVKDFNFFGKDKHTTSGYNCRCKDCCKKQRDEKQEYYKNYRETNKEKNIVYQKQYREDNKEVLKERVLANLTEDKKLNKKTYLKSYVDKNKHILSLNKKIYVEKNKEEIQQYQKKYRQDNKERVKLLHSAYVKKRKETDNLFKLQLNIRDLISKSIKGKGFTKKSKTFILLGCDSQTFKSYLESLFLEGMCWENHGINGWHIDHIFPNALCKTEDELIKNQHYLNLQPLWAKENLKKGKKIPTDLEI